MKPVAIRFCGFGGQGIVLSAVIFGTAAVNRRGLYAVQTQSYGSEARGGQCQAELIISREQINSPVLERKDIMVALSQAALDRYIGSLKPDGLLIVDPKLVTKVPETTATLLKVPATEIATGLGNRIAANMVMLGFLQEYTGLISREDLVEAVRGLVPARYLDLNLRAVDAGLQLARQVKAGAV